LISLPETIVKVAAVLLKLTSVVPVRLFPRIVTALPTLPEVGVGFDKWTEPHRQTEDVATAPTYDATPVIGATVACNPVEGPVGGFHPEQEMVDEMQTHSDESCPRSANASAVRR